MSGEVAEAEEAAQLARALAVLANETRLRILHRLARPAFVRDLTSEFGITRQAMQRHLDDMVALGLLEQHHERRGPLPASQYVASPAGMFALKEQVLALALPPVPARPLVERSPTRPTLDGRAATGRGPRVAGLLLVHGDAPGRWIELDESASSWIVGRDPSADVRLDYDPFVSGRHAHLARDADGGWRLQDLQSTNGTAVNFERLAPGEERVVASGDLLTIGKSHLLLRAGTGGSPA